MIAQLWPRNAEILCSVGASSVKLFLELSFRLAKYDNVEALFKLAVGLIYNDSKYRPVKMVMAYNVRCVLRQLACRPKQFGASIGLTGPRSVPWHTGDAGDAEGACDSSHHVPFMHAPHAGKSEEPGFFLELEKIRVELETCLESKRAEVQAKVCWEGKTSCYVLKRLSEVGGHWRENQEVCNAIRTNPINSLILIWKIV